MKKVILALILGSLTLTMACDNNNGNGYRKSYNNGNKGNDKSQMNHGKNCGCSRCQPCCRCG